MSVAVILGSAFDEPVLGGRTLDEVRIGTRFGEAVLHRYPRTDGDAWVLFRHGAPHRFLPNQIPYRAQALALQSVGCGALLVTSSVGVLDPDVPLDSPLLVNDIVMLDNRLPDGSACTVYPEPREDQAHLVLDEGIISRALNRQMTELAAEAGDPVAAEVEFAHVMGPRTKTAAENRIFANLGVQVNSMTVGPEVVLANELRIPCAALVMGHKYSRPGVRERLDRDTMDDTLHTAKRGLGQLARVFVERGRDVPFANRLYRY